MAILTRERLEALLQPGAGPCISLYLPTHRHHPGTEQDPIRFRHALREAERLLAGRHPEEEVRALLDPVAALPTTEFWRHQGDGLAVFRSRDVLEEFRLPLRVPELVVVAGSFHVRPLIRCLNSNERFFLLALSQGGAAVYHASLESLSRVLVPNLPESLAAFRGGGKYTRALSGVPSGRGRGGQRLNPAGGPEDSSDADLVEYFRAIDRALQRSLRQDDAPVILAGVEYYLPIYRRVTRLKRLADTSVSGSPDAMTESELGERARAAAEHVLRGSEERALAAYRRAAARGRARTDLDEIVRDARRGRIRRLFLAAGVRVWGTVDPTTGRVRRTAEQQGSHDDDVLDDVAEAVLRSGGEVLTLPRERMPDGVEVAAESS